MVLRLGWCRWPVNPSRYVYLKIAPARSLSGATSAFICFAALMQGAAFAVCTHPHRGVI